MINKAILVIDMPKCCSKCKFLNDNYDYPECIITGVYFQNNREENG